ncbi:hypothetical protein JCM10213_000771 [Rhodosporidiobolus nylandii]
MADGAAVDPSTLPWNRSPLPDDDPTSSRSILGQPISHQHEHDQQHQHQSQNQNQQQYLPPTPTTQNGDASRPHSAHTSTSLPLHTSTFSRPQPHPAAPSLPSLASTDPSHAWRDNDRRKSVRMDPASGVGGAASSAAEGWGDTGEAQRRASWAGYSGTTGSAAAYSAEGRPYTQPGLQSVPQGSYLSQQQPPAPAAAWSAYFPAAYAPTASTSAEGSSAASGSFSSAFSAYQAAHAAHVAHQQQQHAAYLAAQHAGTAVPAAYQPFSVAQAQFSAYAAYGQQATPGSSVFASPYAPVASTSTAAVHPAYLTSPYSSSLANTAVTPAVLHPSTSAATYAPASPISPTFPVNASTPYIPGTSTSPSAAVLAAAANRTKLGALDLTGHTRDAAASRRPAVTGMSTRRAVELSYSCENCRRRIGTLTLRGGAVERQTGNEPSKYAGSFYCGACVAVPPPSSAGSSGGSLPPNLYAGEASYYDTLSCAVDEHLGEDTKARDVRPPPAAPGKTRSGFTPLASLAPGQKKRRSSVVDSSEGILACDVCHRDLASGTLALTTGETVGATIEVICAHCESRYMRCSDCGGGGGQKGVGRWRCKEVFTNGRKTCFQPHTRIGTVNEMDYDIYTVSSLSRTDVFELVEHCRDLYYNTLLATLAVPDMIESACPIARDYGEVEKICVDSWTTYEPLITQDIESSSNSRRYLALRWARPSTRKKKGSKKASGDSGSPDTSTAPLPRLNGNAALTDSHVPSGSSRPVIREGKILTGFILAEHDLTLGQLHIALTLPTGAGESYDASTRLLQTLVARVHDDLKSTNAHRSLMGLQPHPELKMMWTMHMTKRDSRIMSRLETRRGFIPLEDYILKNPDANLSTFPPHRGCYLPPELLRGWGVFAKRLSDEDLPPSPAIPAPSSRPATSAGTAADPQYSPRASGGESRRASAF